MSSYDGFIGSPGKCDWQTITLCSNNQLLVSDHFLTFEENFNMDSTPKPKHSPPDTFNTRASNLKPLEQFEQIRHFGSLLSVIRLHCWNFGDSIPLYPWPVFGLWFLWNQIFILLICIFVFCLWTEKLIIQRNLGTQPVHISTVTLCKWLNRGTVSVI